jgi:hypothetical protein
LSIIPEQNFDGEALVVLRAEDDDHNYALEEFKVILLPEPDIPTVEILAPMNNSIVSNQVTISGRAFDAEGELKLVEVKIGNNQWDTANGDVYWSYTWDTRDYIGIMDSITIKARAMDIVDWADSDGDGVGDNSDQFPNEPTQWYDVDGDGYGDNPSGSAPDAFPLDPTQWTDSDLDGFGDNPMGNNPDYYPDNAKRHSKEGDQEQGMFTTKNLMWLAILSFIIIDLIIFMLYIKKRKKTKENQEENE